MGNDIDMCAGFRNGDTDEYGGGGGGGAPSKKPARAKEHAASSSSSSCSSPTDDDGRLYDVLDKRSDEVWVWRVGRRVASWRDAVGCEHATVQLLDPRDLSRSLPGEGDTIDVLREDIQLFEGMHAKSVFDAEAWGSYLGIDTRHIATPVGLQIDVLDMYTDSRGRKAQKWRKAEVSRTNELCTSITVHYHGWSRRYDEDINLLRDCHARIRKFGSESDPRPATATPKKNEEDSAKERAFSLQLANNRRGQMKVHVVEGDGNCMFRAVAHQIWGDPERHGLLRQLCCDYMESKGIGRELLVDDYDDAKFKDYITERRRDKVWGDDPEIRAMEEIIDLPIEVWNTELEDGGQEPSTIHLSGSFPPNKVAGETCRPIRLSYHGNSHYNSVIVVASPSPLFEEDFKGCVTQDIYDWRRGEQAAGSLL